LQKYKKEYQEFKGDLKEQIDNTQNPIIRGAAGAKDAIFAESACARAVKEMQRKDPNF
jgi:hypothetical protein